MFRLILVLAVAAFGTLASLSSPFNGLLYYMWVAHFRPEAWVWTDLVGNLNLSLTAGVLTVAATLFGRDRFRFDLRVGLVLLFGVQNLISTLMSPYYKDVWGPFVDFAKALTIVCIIPTLVSDLTRFRRVLVVIAVSLGFEGTKQGWAELILNPGGQNLNTVAHLGDNNAVAVGMLAVAAIVIALASTATRTWERRLFQFMFVGLLYRAISTYSRGGLLACAGMCLWFLFRSKQRAVAIVGLAFAFLIILPVLPSEFWERMNTINEARTNLEEADLSILSRLHFWQVAIQMANKNPILGVGNFGFNSAYNDYDTSNGEFGTNRSVHNSWLGVLSELGYPGLILYIAQFVLAFLACARARAAAARGAPKAFVSYAMCLEMSLISYAVGGTFVITQYNELLWHVIGLTIALNMLAMAATNEAGAAPEPVGVDMNGLSNRPVWGAA